MCRRYIDAVKVFCYFLQYAQRNKHVIARSSQADLTKRRIDQMRGLLGMAYVLSGASNAAQNGGGGADGGRDSTLIDEGIYAEMVDTLEKMGDRWRGMRAATPSAESDAAFSSVFQFAAPKFLTVCMPNFEAPRADVHAAAMALQLRQFLAEVHSRAKINELYSYLKLFTSISVSKLALFLKIDEEATQALLLKLVHKSRQQRWVAGGSPADAAWAQVHEVHFTLQRDVVVVADQRAQKRFGDFFIRQAYRLHDLTQDCKAMKAQPRR